MVGMAILFCSALVDVPVGMFKLVLFVVVFLLGVLLFRVFSSVGVCGCAFVIAGHG